MKILLLCVATVALSGCGKSIDQLRATGHSILDIGFKVYEDVKDNVESAKKVILEPTPAPNQ